MHRPVAPRQAGGPRRPRFAPEEPDPAECLVGQAQAGVAVRPIDDESRTQLGFGVGALVGEADRVDRLRPSRQHRPALDEDQLAGDRDERTHVTEPVGLEPAERVQIGVSERAEGHGQDVELAGLDERQEEAERAVEGLHLDLRPALRAASVTERHGRWGRRHGRDEFDADELGAGRSAHRHQLASSARRSSSPNSGSVGASW